MIHLSMLAILSTPLKCIPGFHGSDGSIPSTTPWKPLRLVRSTVLNSHVFLHYLRLKVVTTLNTTRDAQSPVLSPTLSLLTAPYGWKLGLIFIRAMSGATSVS